MNAQSGAPGRKVITTNRRARHDYFIDERLATRLDLVQVRRAKRKICCSWENKIGNFEVAHRPIIRCGECVNFFGDAQRCFAGFIIWSNIAHDCWINSLAENNDYIISNFRTISGAGESLVVVRLLSVFFGLLSVAALYRLARRLFGAPVGVLAAAALAVSFWGLMYSRFKLRQVSMVAPMLLAFDFSLEEPKRVVIVGDPDKAETCALLRAAHSV